MRGSAVLYCGVLPWFLTLSLQAESVDEITVTARGLALQTMADAYGTVVLSREQLAILPALRLDEKLASEPAFSLFRRSGSEIAHPTAQGVTLRSVGPNGAGRTLVLLDGVPQGDPFGGWVNWARLPVIDIDRVAIVKGGGTGPWGNGALAGTVILTTETPDAPETRVSTSYGSFNTVDASLSSYLGTADAGVSVSGNYYRTDGAYIVGKDQRGTADVRARGENGWVRLRGVKKLSSAYTLSVSAGYSDETRLNGTAYTGNGSEVWEASSRLQKTALTPADWAVDAVIYVRDQSFYSRFSGVAEDRNSETPALNQFDVPATAMGGTIVFRRSLQAGWKIEIGADYRRTKGSTHERYFYSEGRFVRERSAGGVQSLAGSFLEATYAVSPRFDVAFGARLDYSRNSAGYREEKNLLTEAPTRSDSYAVKETVLPGGRFGFTWQAADDLTVFGAAYSGVRAPSLNELYRPYRVGGDITEANPELDIEKLYGVEAGYRFTLDDNLTFKARYFRNWLIDGVGNTTLATSGYYAPLATFVPEGGSLSQRLNVDRIIVDGVELDVALSLTKTLTFDAAYFWNKARITKNTMAPGTEGNRLAQTPEHKAHMSLTWEPAEKWLVRVSADMSSKQYDDDGNSRKLAGYTTADMMVSYRLREGLRLYVAGVNVTDQKVVTGLRSNGVRSVAEPASFRVGVDARF